MTPEDEYLEALVREADENPALMEHGTEWESVFSIMDRADVVWAIWQDKDESRGVGWRLVKGYASLKMCAVTKQPIQVKMTAFWCVEGAQAAALEQDYAKRTLAKGGPD